MHILTDTLPTTLPRRAVDVAHPLWCDRSACITSPGDEYQAVTHRIATSVGDHGRVEIAQTQHLDECGHVVAESAVVVYVIGPPDGELEPLLYARRLLAVCRAQQHVREFAAAAGAA